MSCANIYFKQITLSTKYHWNELNQNSIEKLTFCVKHQKKPVIIPERSVYGHE